MTEKLFPAPFQRVSVQIKSDEIAFRRREKHPLATYPISITKKWEESGRINPNVFGKMEQRRTGRNLSEREIKLHWALGPNRVN